MDRQQTLQLSQRIERAIRSVCQEHEICGALVVYVSGEAVGVAAHVVDAQDLELPGLLNRAARAVCHEIGEHSDMVTRGVLPGMNGGGEP